MVLKPTSEITVEVREIRDVSILVDNGLENGDGSERLIFIPKSEIQNWDDLDDGVAAARGRVGDDNGGAGLADLPALGGIEPHSHHVAAGKTALQSSTSASADSHSAASSALSSRSSRYAASSSFSSCRARYSRTASDTYALVLGTS